MESEHNGGDNDGPIVFPVSLTTGQRLVVKLPPVNSLKTVQQDAGNNLGSNVKWHKAVCSNIFESSDENDGGKRTSPIITVLKEGSSTHFTKSENGRVTNETLNVDSQGNASVVLLATNPGFCEIKIPFYDPCMDGQPTGKACSITIAAEICDVPCSSTLRAILVACKDSSKETENFTTLRSLLEHKFFESLGVGDLANVMSEYEIEFANEGKRKKGREEVNVL